ncbi:hypothetical protein JN06_02052 [Bacteroides zoogleoformans]|nr:hypothetical protein JN06_02052 [Bacteroides zoogleoformans]
MNYKGLAFSGGFLNMGDGNIDSSFAPMVEKHVEEIMHKIGIAPKFDYTLESIPASRLSATSFSSSVK